MFKIFLLKSLRQKAFLFWSFIFPLALMTCFKIAFGNLNVTDSIDTRRAAVVHSGSGNTYSMAFDEVMNILSEEGSNTDGSELFELSDLKDTDEAETALLEDEADVVFVVGEDSIEILLPEKADEITCKIAAGVVESFNMRYHLISDAWENNPSEAEAIIDSLSEEVDEVIPDENSFVDNSPNPYIWYFYSTLIMGILFNAMGGIEIVSDLKADVTREAMRISLSPTRKSALLLSAFFCRLLICLSISAIQLVVMRTAFDIPLGSDPVKLVVFVIAANIFAVSLGEFLGSLLKGSIDRRQNIATALIMISVFLSGEMIAQLPGFIEKYCPIINDINPATVMNFALYRLAYTKTEGDFYINMGKIILAAAVMLTISVIVLRRERYESV